MTIPVRTTVLSAMAGEQPYFARAKRSALDRDDGRQPDALMAADIGEPFDVAVERRTVDPPMTHDR